MNDTEARPGIAVITGASGGMGSCSARQLAAQGAPLLLCDLDLSRIEQVAAPLRESGITVECLAGDIADPAFPGEILSALGDRPIRALIHTAGLSPTLADGPRIFEVNYMATVRLVDALRPRMAEGGCAVLISSMSAHFVKTPEIDLAGPDRHRHGPRRDGSQPANPRHAGAHPA